MAEETYDRILVVKNEVFVYKIPPRGTNRGYRAADWSLDNPDWTGRLRAVANGKSLVLKLEDRLSGELFAACPVDGYPGIAVEQVLDSSRYFVIRITDGSGKKAFIGMGFADRADSFDLIVTMQDHFKYCKREDAEKEQIALPFDSGPKLDLGFKEGQTIKIKINTKKSEEGDSPKARRKPHTGTTTGFLPPPPGGIKFPAPPKASTGPTQPRSVVHTTTTEQPPAMASELKDLFGLATAPSSSVQLNQPNQLNQPSQPNTDPWGDFTSAGGSAAGSSSASDTVDWVTF